MNTKEIVANLKYDYAWIGEVPLLWNGTKYKVQLVIKADDGRAITESQECALNSFLGMQDILTEELVNALAEFCSATYKTQIDRASLLNYIRPTGVVIDYNGDWGVTFATPWDDDADVAMKVSNGDVEVGLDEIII